MTLCIEEYISYLHKAVNDGKTADTLEEFNEWKPVQFFVSGKYFQEVWATIDEVCNSDLIERHRDWAVRTNSEKRSHVIIETDDWLYYDMAVCEVRFQKHDKDGLPRIERENTPNDCICVIVPFKRYRIKPKVGRLMLDSYLKQMKDLRKSRGVQESDPRDPTTLEEMYLRTEIEGAIGSTWITYDLGSWLSFYKRILLEELKRKNITKASRALLEFERNTLNEHPHINCYIDHLLEREWQAVFASVKAELDDRAKRKRTPTAGTPIMKYEGWNGLREGLQKVAIEAGEKAGGFDKLERDAEALAMFYVPPEPKASYNDISNALGLGIDGRSIGTQIRKLKGKIDNSTIGKLGEAFVASQIDSLRPRVGTGGRGQSDVLCTVDDRTVALNVKLCFEKGLRELLPSGPESEHEVAYLVLLLPRLLEVRLYPVVSAETMVNSRLGVLSAIEDLERTLKGLIEVRR